MKLWKSLATGFAVCVLGLAAFGQGTSVVDSKHDLSFVFGSGTVANNEVCKPCHTPHNVPAANQDLSRLWNHEINPASAYTLHGTGASYMAGLDETSRKCLGCHDGTIAIDAYGGHEGASVGKMGATVGVDTTGFVIGAGGNLEHDHPVGVQYNTASRMAAATETTTTWTTTSYNDPAKFTGNGVTGVLVYKNLAGTAIGAPGGRGVSFYRDSVNKQVVVTGPITSTVDKLYVTCGSCHTPHNPVYNFLKIPNVDSQLCLTCHVK
jgi:predicted CXXCH cytochrome family protein